jgi:hypothetical protein
MVVEIRGCIDQILFLCFKIMIEDTIDHGKFLRTVFRTRECIACEKKCLVKRFLVDFSSGEGTLVLLQ